MDPAADCRRLFLLERHGVITAERDGRYGLAEDRFGANREVAGLVAVDDEAA